jgi:hypothetical protein
MKLLFLVASEVAIAALMAALTVDGECWADADT